MNGPVNPGPPIFSHVPCVDFKPVIMQRRKKNQSTSYQSMTVKSMEGHKDYQKECTESESKWKCVNKKSH